MTPLAVLRLRLRAAWRAWLCALGKCPRGKAGHWCNGRPGRCGWPED